MKFTLLFSFSFFLFVSQIFAQVTLIPYLSNGYYGLVNEKGETVVKPQYEEIENYLDVENLFAVKQNGLWGFIDSTGNEIIKPFLKNYRLSTAFGNAVSKNKWITNYQIVKIYDVDTKNYYFLNPSFPLKKYVPYISLDKLDYKNTFVASDNSPLNKIIKVATQDKKVTFLNVKGEAIFPNGVFDGEVLSQHLIAIKNKQGKFALFNSDAKQLSDFEYHKFRKTENENYFIGIKKIKGDNNEIKYRKSLFNNKGKIIIFNKNDIISINEKTIIINDDVAGGVYDYTGKNLFKIKHCSISRNYVSNYFYVKSKNGKGICDIKGKLLVDTIYSEVKILSNGKILFNKENGGGLLSKEFKEIFYLDTLKMNFGGYAHPGHYEIFNNNYQYRHGVVDSLGNVIIYPLYNELRYAKCKTFYVYIARKDSIKNVINTNGKIILSIPSEDVGLNCKEKVIYRVSKSMIYTYSFQGELLNKIEKDKNQKWKRDKNKIEKIYDKRGNEIDQSNYSRIVSSYDSKAQKTIFFGIKKNDNLNLVDVFNDNGRNIIPVEYVLPRNWLRKYTGVNGGIPVAYVEDIMKKKYSFRCGVIDFNGNWLIKPEYRTIRVLGSELFVTISPLGKTKLYNRYGKVISEKSYDFYENNDDIILNDRITVGYLLNKKEYMKSRIKAKEISDKIIDSKKLKKEDFGAYLNSTNNQKIILGFINSKGEEVIPVKYLHADPFRYRYTSVSSIDSDGFIYSAIIDSKGNNLLTTPYEQLKILSRDTTLLLIKNKGLSGIMNLDGDIIIEPIYKTIRLLRNGMYIATDTVSTYVIGKIKRTRLNHVGASINYFSKNYFVVEFKDAKQLNLSFYYLFDQTNESYFDLSKYTKKQGYRISNKIFDLTLPKGFVAIKESRNTKPFVVNLETKMEYRATK